MDITHKMKGHTIKCRSLYQYFLLLLMLSTTTGKPSPLNSMPLSVAQEQSDRVILSHSTDPEPDKLHNQDPVMMKSYDEAFYESNTDAVSEIMPELLQQSQGHGRNRVTHRRANLDDLDVQSRQDRNDDDFYRGRDDSSYARQNNFGQENDFGIGDRLYDPGTTSKATNVEKQKFGRQAQLQAVDSFQKSMTGQYAAEIGVGKDNFFGGTDFFGGRVESDSSQNDDNYNENTEDEGQEYNNRNQNYRSRGQNYNSGRNYARETQNYNENGVRGNDVRTYYAREGQGESRSSDDNDNQGQGDPDSEGQSSDREGTQMEGMNGNTMFFMEEVQSKTTDNMIDEFSDSYIQTP